MEVFFKKSIKVGPAREPDVRGNRKKKYQCGAAGNQRNPGKVSTCRSGSQMYKHLFRHVFNFLEGFWGHLEGSNLKIRTRQILIGNDRHLLGKTAKFRRYIFGYML